MEPAARKQHLLSLFNQSAQEYVAQNATVGKDTSLTLHPLLVPRYGDSNAVPLPVLHQYRNALFHSDIMEVLCKLTVWCKVIIDNTGKAKVTHFLL